MKKREKGGLGEFLVEILDSTLVFFFGNKKHRGQFKNMILVAALIVAGFVIPAVTILLGLWIYFMTEDITWQRWVVISTIVVAFVVAIGAMVRMTRQRWYRLPPPRTWRRLLTRRLWYHLLLLALGTFYGFLVVREVWYATDPGELAQFVMFTGIVVGFIVRVALGGIAAGGVDVAAMVLGEKDDPRFLRGYFRAISWIISGEIAIALFGLTLAPKFLIIGIVSAVLIGTLAYSLGMRIMWDRALLRVHVLVLVWIFLAAIPQGVWLEFTTVNLRPFFQLHRASVIAHRQHDRQVRREVELERGFVMERFAEIERELGEAKTLEEVRAARAKREAFEAEIAQDGAAAKIAAAIKSTFPR